MLRRLFGKKEKNPDTRSDLLRVVENAVTSILLPNIEMLGLEPFKAPLGGATTTKKARGYLLGLAEAVIQQFAAMQPTEDEFLVSATSAVMVVHGNEQPKAIWHLVLNTIDEFQANDPDVVAGHSLAYNDVALVYSNEPFKIALGFYSIVTDA